MKKFVLLGMTAMGFALEAEPLYFDSHGLPVPISTRTICGTNDMVAVKDQNETIRQLARPVGVLEGPGYLCTGTLISKDVFLTARHCYSQCNNLSVKFNYLGRSQESFECEELIEKGADDYNQDYMLIRLKGSPGVEWSWYSLSDRSLTDHEPLIMIHHPGGMPMKASINNCLFEKESEGLLYHSCDTNPGSSGAAIVAPDFDFPEKSRVVGIHAFGGCNSNSTNFNAGPAIRFVSTISKTIQEYLE